MERYICIHGHFYQPPRENPWLEEIEIEDSSAPYHDWTERVTAECYAPNSASRLLDGEGRIVDIVNNYERMSFNFGPTLLSWMAGHSPEIYAAILEADKRSAASRSGHGNALAQGYNHIIMPLATARDKRTQIRWGISDFAYRFKRQPEGLWLPETAVDTETLDILAEEGITFTILAPHQATKVRKIGADAWEDTGTGGIDPTMSYLCILPSGRRINIFFYDGPISRAIAFEGLLNKGETLVTRLLAGFSDSREWRQFLHVATDGESYGHHHKFGDMALAYALHQIESEDACRLSNYGEYLQQNPPTHEVQVIDNSSWSCAHGIERWRSNCGCNSGGHPGWNQEWRAPLRKALDWLRDRVSPLFEEKAATYLKEPWAARDDYILTILNREDGARAFFEKWALRSFSEAERTIVLELMELQRHALLMYTSCGWFFDELSGIETLQIMQYAGRVVQLAEKLFDIELEAPFKEMLAAAKSNISKFRDGSAVYDIFVKTAIVDLKKVAAHYALSSLILDYSETTKVYCYTIKREDYQRRQGGEAKLAIGRVEVASNLVLESETFGFAVLHLGGHIFNGGLKVYSDDGPYQSMKEEILTAFEQGALADIIRLMDKHFGANIYSLRNLFKDEQRSILNLVTLKATEDFEHSFRLIFENHRSLMSFLQEAGIPIPKGFLAAAEFTLSFDIKKAFSEEKLDPDRIKTILNDIGKWDLQLESAGLEFILRRKGEDLLRRLQEEPSDMQLLADVMTTVELIAGLPPEMNYWQLQNTYFKMAKSCCREFMRAANNGDETAAKLAATYKRIGELLSFNTSVLFPEGGA